jgi:hypothetical protein
LLFGRNKKHPVINRILPEIIVKVNIFFILKFIIAGHYPVMRDNTIKINIYNYVKRDPASLKIIFCACPAPEIKIKIRNDVCGRNNLYKNIYQDIFRWLLKCSEARILLTRKISRIIVGGKKYLNMGECQFA